MYPRAVDHRIQWGLSILGVLVAAVTLGLSGGGVPSGLQDTVGELRVEEGQLLMPAGSYASFGEGNSIEVQARMKGVELDLTHGTLDELHHFAHIRERIGIHDSKGTSLGRGHPQPWPEESSSVRFTCRPHLTLEVNGAGVEIAEPVKGCPRAPMGVRATTEVRLEKVSIDAVEVPLQGSSLDLSKAALVLVGGLLSLALLGPSAFVLLCLMPGVGLVEPLGLPAASAAWLLYGAGASMALTRGPSRRQVLAGLACLLALGLAGRSFVQTIGPIGLEATDADNVAVARVLETTMGLDAYQHKVDLAVDFYRPKLAARPKDKPLVVTLGSSSTGGNDPRGFWPEMLGKRLPEAHTQTLAWGGATSWHMRQVLKRLNVHAEACVIFMGHNDTLPSVPGQSIASLERKEEPYSESFVAPVPLVEAEDNLAAIAEHCGVLVAMEEYSIGREEDLSAYAAMLVRMPQVLYLDGASQLRKRPSSVVMVDSVHPSPAGQAILGELVADTLRPMLLGEP